MDHFSIRTTCPHPKFLTATRRLQLSFKGGEDVLVTVASTIALASVGLSVQECSGGGRGGKCSSFCQTWCKSELFHSIFSHFFTSNFTDTSVASSVSFDDMFPERLNAASSCCSEERDGQVFFARSDGSNGQYWRLSQPPVQAPAPDVASAVSSNFDFL